MSEVCKYFSGALCLSRVELERPGNRDTEMGISD